MSNTNETQITASKSPTHYAYRVVGKEGSKGFWNRIGSAWANADGKGFNIQLDAVPVNGKLTLRVVSDRK
jgi:hypothetical protein